VLLHSKLYNEGRHDLYSAPNNIRVLKSSNMRWAGNVARTGEKRNSYRLSEGKTKRNDSDGKNIKMDFKVCADIDWIYMAMERETWRIIVDRVINFRFP